MLPRLLWSVLPRKMRRVGIIIVVIGNDMQGASKRAPCRIGTNRMTEETVVAFIDPNAEQAIRFGKGGDGLSLIPNQ